MNTGMTYWFTTYDTGVDADYWGWRSLEEANKHWSALIHDKNLPAGTVFELVEVPHGVADDDDLWGTPTKSWIVHRDHSRRTND